MAQLAWSPSKVGGAMSSQGQDGHGGWPLVVTAARDGLDNYNGLGSRLLMFSLAVVVFFTATWIQTVIECRWAVVANGEWWCPWTWSQWIGCRWQVGVGFDVGSRGTRAWTRVHCTELRGRQRQMQRQKFVHESTAGGLQRDRQQPCSLVESLIKTAEHTAVCGSHFHNIHILDLLASKVKGTYDVDRVGSDSNVRGNPAILSRI